ncbi:hypothetical protein VC83_04090 [Pseudogymnoascus destructans]|uniref:Uncharacterized protein n=2 Tax=Pseudogymnoascus destructans TaxID=655981 RepID=L8FSF5_PSED2|nr:uncharacterized protein VC83_04090 [Pseudogymnoascus destructans]ELR02621.1 hypothetical protein GMDG_05584 [Pseudogymnoascus destructans 20631-21]OAF59513.1 hypothetical protein VC83_04090 [Pseudogymnoascus destructans]
MEHSDETGLPSRKPESNSSQLEDTAELQQELPKLAYKTLSYHQVKTAAEREARGYMASWPMNVSAAKNIPFHGSIIGLFRDICEPLSFNALVLMRKSIDYHMNQVMGAATMYKNFWDIDMPDCRQVDVEAYIYDRNLIDAFFHLVCRYALFDEPNRFQGHRYVKGYNKYIAGCIDHAGWDLAKAEAKLDALVQCKGTLPYYAFSLHGIKSQLRFR